MEEGSTDLNTEKTNEKIVVPMIPIESIESNS